MVEKKSFVRVWLIGVTILLSIGFIGFGLVELVHREEGIVAVCSAGSCDIFPASLVEGSPFLQRGNCFKFTTHYEGKTIPAWQCD